MKYPAWEWQELKDHFCEDKDNFCQEDKKLKDEFCQESGGLVKMKIGEVRVAEDSDFALLKVNTNITIIISIIVIFIITAILIEESSKFPTENSYFCLGY